MEIQREKVNRMERVLQDINIHSKEIDKYVKARQEVKLSDQKSKLDNIVEKLKVRMDKLEEINKLMSAVNEELANHQLKERELQDNMKLIECQEKILKIEEKLSDLQEQLGSEEILSLMQKKDTLLKLKEDLLSEQHIARGRENELQQNVLQLTKKTESDMYKNADKKHRDKVIDLKTTELTCNDLNKYYIALDRAILRYHAMKMSEVNKIIRELWMKTYAGNDIDYIEIKADDDQAFIGLERRRTYNYKVVMIKGDIEIDMRGRCSAGQKVLASLIIRLALAETFCLNCGILALDEPTTNLDRENIEHLAQALAEIVQSRSNQRNFQLIIITHDEEFIELLGRADAVEYYYRVNKDSFGFSKITKCLFSSMG
ncbi:DNA repair protein RAD50-like [Centruroides sculpturatus]|uniref:DNA repair protein RAD50-like n=1 Tax=Centruroides sculpturatus TaxID=218467 RepID=UPI000C6EF4DE|nr:DNA repair protein RAD50-like [Centruroides sculpturatus]